MLHRHRHHVLKLPRLLQVRGLRSLPREPVKKGNVSTSLTVPDGIKPPPYVSNRGVDPGSGASYSMFDLNSQEMVNMRDACKHARDTLEYAGSLVKPGVTTDEIDRKVHENIIARNVYPSPLGYRGFPKSLCSSVNEVLCHGIPDDRELVEGDIVNLDVSCYTGGFHGDTSRTFKVGQVSEVAEELMKVTESALEEAIKICGPGTPLGSIGEKIFAHTLPSGFQVNRKYCGHGIGRTFHMLPYVLHFPNNQSPLVLGPGLVFTIEPIICEGDANEEVIWDDKWTIATLDGGLSAQYEHTIVITDHGAEILT